MKRSEVLAQMPVSLMRQTGRIIELHRGEENKITKPELLEALRRGGFANEKNLARKIRTSVTELRKAGVLICSNSGTSGYWMAANAEDVDMTINEFLGRISEYQKIVAALREARDERFIRRGVYGTTQPGLGLAFVETTTDPGADGGSEDTTPQPDEFLETSTYQ